MTTITEGLIGAVYEAVTARLSAGGSRDDVEVRMGGALRDYLAADFAHDALRPAAQGVADQVLGVSLVIDDTIPLPYYEIVVRDRRRIV